MAVAVRDEETVPIPPSPSPARLGFERADLVLRAAAWMTNDARLDAAERLTRHLLAREPEHAEALSLLASIRERAGDLDGAFGLIERARRLLPDSPRLHSKYIFALDRDPSATLEQAHAARRAYNDLVKRPVPLRHPNDPDPERVLRVGYVSGDFLQHSAAYSWGPFVLKHDPRAVEVYAYHCSTRADWLTETFRAAIPRWRDCGALDDDALEARIRADRIDILVDLAGHSGNNRLPVFARKPAPIQCTGWGYITGTGLDAIDYLFADRDTIRPGEQHHYAEEPVWIDRILAYWPPADELVGPIAPAPHVANGHLTFGVFQQLRKINPASVALWAAILDRVPTSRLVIKSAALDEEPSRARLGALFASRGADLGRILFLGNTGQVEHMREYARVDACLDPWPDGGGISTLEAACMGVPTLTLPHVQIPSRVTTSVNRELGLGAFVATSADDYVERAVRLDAQRGALAEMRPHLRDLLYVSAFGDHERYARTVEAAYREMWRRWLASTERGAA